MYKSRIWKWGLDKKLKSDEVLAILILKSKREAIHRRTEFTIRGQPVDMDNINRYVKRNPGLVARFHAGQVPNAQTTIEVQCHTPLTSPAPSLAPPVELNRAEEIMFLFRDYVDRCLTTGTWQCEYDYACTSRTSGDRQDDLLERLVGSLAIVNRCLTRGDAISISEILNPAFESLQEIIVAESPLFAARILCLLWYLDQHLKSDLLRLVVDYLRGLLPILLGPDHSLARIWRILGTTRFPDYTELSLGLYGMLIPLFEERLGPANYVTTAIYSDHIDCLYQRNATSGNTLTIASRYRAKAEATGHTYPWLTELAISQTALICASKTSEGFVGEAIASLQTLRRYPLTDEQEAVLDVQLGNYHFQLDNLPATMTVYRRALRLVTMSDEPNERLLLTCLANMESVLTRTGRVFEAHRVTQYRLKRVADFARGYPSMIDAASAPQGLKGPVISTYPFVDTKGIPSWLWEDDTAYSAPIPKLPISASHILEEAPWMDLVSCEHVEWPTTRLLDEGRAQSEGDRIMSAVIEGWENTDQWYEALEP